MKTSKWTMAAIVAIVTAIILTSCLVLNGWAPSTLSLNNSQSLQGIATAFASLLAWLFIVSLFIERAVEVVIMLLRDNQADLLEQQEHTDEGTLGRATVEAARVVGDNTAAKAEVEQARDSLAITKGQLLNYRHETKQIAMLIGFSLGILAGIAGVRAFSGILKAGVEPSFIFRILDILITGLIIAGGSEGVHRMANAFTSAMDALSARGDQAQRIANQKATTSL